jgi:hypothetical protein
MLLPNLRHLDTPDPAAILGAGVSLSHLSSFRGPAQFVAPCIDPPFGETKEYAHECLANTIRVVHGIRTACRTWTGHQL